jgi:hypothetical protein
MARRGAPPKPSLRLHPRKDGETSFFVRLSHRRRRHEFVFGRTPSMSHDDRDAVAELTKITAELTLSQWSPPTDRLDEEQVATIHEIFEDALPADLGQERTQAEKVRRNHIEKHLLPYFVAETRSRDARGNPQFGPRRRLDDITGILENPGAGCVQVHKRRQELQRSAREPRATQLSTLRAILDEATRRHPGDLAFNPV